MIQQFASEGSPIYLPKFGSVFSRIKIFCLENDVFLAFGLGMCEGVGEDSRHGIGHVDIQVRSCILKELVFLDSIDSPVGNIYIILQTKSLATVMRTKL